MAIMNLEKKVSVLVPAYNVDEYLDQCIESICNQIYSNLEIIIVDDGSTDRCPEICDSWAKKDERVIVCHKENGGLVSARKAGAQLATGQLITYVDGDDWLEMDAISSMVSDLEQYGVDIVIYGFIKELYGKQIRYQNNIPESVYKDEQLKKDVICKMIFDLDQFQCGVYTYVWNKLFKREVVLANQLDVDERIVIGEDAAVVYPSIVSADAIYISEKCKYHYRQRMNSILRSVEKNPKKIEQLKNLYDYLSKWNRDMQDDSLVQKQIDHYYLSQLIMLSDTLVEVNSGIKKTFPFLDIDMDDSVIIYSAGAYGIHLYHQFVHNGIRVCGWTDPDYEEYDCSEYHVEAVDECMNRDYDYILIASIDKKYVHATVDLLMRKGIKREKIKTVFDNIDELFQVCME